MALAAFDPDSPRWQGAARSALVEMLKADPLHLGPWVDALRLVKRHLLPPLERVFRGKDDQLADYRQVAASVLADYAADRVETLVELLFDADARQYAVIKPALMKHRNEAITRMRKELAARPDYWKDPPLDPKWKQPPAGLVREIEEASGIVAERFALCQALPIGRVQAVTEGLRAAGYRPVRVRPWKKGSVPFFALVWTRDGTDWTLRLGLTAEGVKVAPAGMIPADVAGYRRKDGDRYAVLWRKPSTGEQAVVYAGAQERRQRLQSNGFRKDGYLPATVQILTGRDGTSRYSGVWRKGSNRPRQPSIPGASPLLRWGDVEAIHDDFVFAGEHLLLDVHLGPARPPALLPAWVGGLAAAPRSLPALGLTPRYRRLESFAAAPRLYASVWRDDTTR